MHGAMVLQETSTTITIDGLEASVVQVYNTFGQMVKAVQNSNEINVDGLSEGIYLLRITDEKGGNQTKRITV